MALPQYKVLLISLKVPGTVLRTNLVVPLHGIQQNMAKNASKLLGDLFGGKISINVTVCTSGGHRLRVETFRCGSPTNGSILDEYGCCISNSFLSYLAL